MTDYRITPKIVYKYNNTWGWYAVRSYAFGGDTPTFYIAKASHYNLAAGMRICCWAQAADTDTWNDFDNVAIGASDIVFSNDDPFPAGMIYVSALPMYPFSRIQRKVGEWSRSQWVGQTTSTTNFIIGNATARSVGDGSGRTAPALPFYGFKITGDRVGNKNKAILSAFSHATETPGPFQFEGAINYLLGASAEAEILRDYFEFYCYPCTNPQGVWSGWFRSTPEIPAHSHDYYWDGSDGEESIAALRTAYAADTGGTIDVGIDYHSYSANTDIHAAVHTGDTGGNYGYFNTEMQILDGDFNLLEQDMSLTEYSYFKTLSASLAITTEQGYGLARGVSEYKTFGENTMKALYEMLIDGRFTYGP